jgi:small subunit ribosomal protein S9
LITSKGIEKRMAQQKKASSKKDSVAKKAPLAHGVGRRKSSVARVWLRSGQGKIMVNGKSHTDYFEVEEARLQAEKPFVVVPSKATYDVSVNVEGGGTVAQADAVKLGISRALVSLDDSIRSVLREHGLLTVDSRNKERKKYGQRGARRKFQFVKR